MRDGALEFAERLLALLESTKRSATYKFATVLAILDVATAHTDEWGLPPDTISAKEVGRRVVELYWPQTRPFAVGAMNQPPVLSQSPQNDLPTKLAAWRVAHNLEPAATLEDAASRDPTGWKDLERRLVAIVVGMPLAKLQRFGDGSQYVEDRFIYEFGWPDEVSCSAVWNAEFDDTIILRPGVAEWLIRLAPLIRPLVQTRWAAMVAARNPKILDSAQLDEFLFGAQRVGLHRIRGPLADYQEGLCFYCDSGFGREIAVDHFLPWSRFPDNTLDNLVAAHPICNGAKSASLAGPDHLHNWLLRVAARPGLDEVEGTTSWPRRRDHVLAAVRASYLWLPTGAKLWQQRNLYVEADHDEILKIFSLAA